MSLDPLLGYPEEDIHFTPILTKEIYKLPLYEGRATKDRFVCWIYINSHWFEPLRVLNLTHWFVGNRRSNKEPGMGFLRAMACRSHCKDKKTYLFQLHRIIGLGKLQGFLPPTRRELIWSLRDMPAVSLHDTYHPYDLRDSNIVFVKPGRRKKYDAPELATSEDVVLPQPASPDEILMETSQLRSFGEAQLNMNDPSRAVANDTPEEALARLQNVQKHSSIDSLLDIASAGADSEKIKQIKAKELE